MRISRSLCFQFSDFQCFEVLVSKIVVFFQTSKASDDLLQLGNPFADMFTQPAAPALVTTFANSVSNNNMWMTNGL